MKTILVTGCAGFIGRHLVECLLKNDYHIIGIDNFAHPYKLEERRAYTYKLCEHPNFSFSEHMVDIDKCKIDAVIHLGAIPGVQPSWDPNWFEAYTDNNVLFTHYLFSHIIKSNRWVQKIILASSSSVYGNSQGDAIEPCSPYAVTKESMENIGASFAHEYDLTIDILRLFSVYGPRQRPDMFFNKLITAALNGQKIHVYNQGDNLRDWTYIGDTISHIMTILKDDNRGVHVNVVDGGTGQQNSVNDAIDIIEGYFSEPIRKEYLPAQTGDVFATKSSTEIIGGTSLREGLDKQMKWHLEGARYDI